MLMDPSRDDAKVLALDPEDFQDNARLRTYVNEYMGGRTEVLSMWRVIDPVKPDMHGFHSHHPGLQRSRWKRVVYT
jgi:hypothetical protein